MSKGYQSVPLTDVSRDADGNTKAVLLVTDGVATDAVPQKGKWVLVSGMVAALIVVVVIAIVFVVGGDEESCDDATQNCLYKQALPERWTDIDQDLPALCTDLTAPGYYFKAGDPTHFALYLGSIVATCYNEQTCWQSPELRSANPSEWVAYEGILDVDSPFTEWSLAASDYCSGDAYIGRRRWDDPSGNPEGLHWAGYSLFYAFLDGLLEDQGMDQADVILISASGQTGQGVYQLMDESTAYLQEKAPNAQIKFLFDSGWTLDGLDNYFTDNANSAIDQDESYEDGVHKSQVNAWNPYMHPDCVADYETETMYKCMYVGNVLYPYLENKDFHLHMNAWDCLRDYTTSIPIDLVENWDEATWNFSTYLANSYIDSAWDTDEETSFSVPDCRERETLERNDAFIDEMMESEWSSGTWDDPMHMIYWRFVMEDENYRQSDSCGEPYCNPTCVDTEADIAADDRDTHTNGEPFPADSEEESSEESSSE